MTPLNTLVLCTGNSARSILLESILNHISSGRIRAFSAGSNPTGKVHPQSLKLLSQLGHDITNARSKSWDEFTNPNAPNPNAPVMDMVITVCGSAAAETCPIWPGVPLRVHWGVDDPAECTTDCDQAFANAYDILSRRAGKLLALPLEEMGTETLERAATKIGTTP